MRHRSCHPSGRRSGHGHADLQAVGDATTDQLRAEGWGGRNPRLSFARVWLHRHDRGYRDALDHATDDEVIARLHERHAHRPTWRIAVVPDPDQPRRLLAARSELGYTTSPHLALPDEPEAVDEATQEAITRAAHQRDQERRHMTASLTHTRLRNDITDLQQRLMAARLTARRRGIGKTTDEALRIAHAQLRRAVDSLEQEATA